MYSEQLDAWLIARGRELVIAEDRAGKRRLLTEAEGFRAAAEHERAAAEHERAAAEHERQLRLDLERRLTELERKR